MQINGNYSNGVMNKLSSVQTAAEDDFAKHLENATDKAKEAKDDAKLKSVCKDMEAMFLNIMLTNMRKTVQKSTLLDNSKEEIMTSMLDSEMTKNMANAGGMGLADMLYRQLHVSASGVKRPQAPE